MIESVRFQNFRCLRKVTLQFAPLTVLVGPNSSGKTTVLDGLRGVDIGASSNYWREDRSRPLSITYTHTDGSVGLAGRTVQPLALDLAGLRGENLLAAAQQLNRSGDNLTNVFASLTRHQQNAVARELCRLVPMFGDVDLEPTVDGRQRLRFQDRWDENLWFSSSRVSDGTMLVLAFLVLQYQTRSADLITIEEPERALHPYLLDELIQFLRKLTTGEVGKKPVQVVLATHSAELLEYVRPEEVRFLTRSAEDGSVQVNEAPTDTPNWQRVYKEYRESLGGIWLSGNLGGVPGR